MSIGIKKHRNVLPFHDSLELLGKTEHLALSYAPPGMALT
jgi:hypothetical protein